MAKSTRSLVHGNDATATVSLFRDGVEIFGWRFGSPPHERQDIPWLPAQPGDELRHVDGGLSCGYRWRHLVTGADIAAGYVVRSEYQGVHGWLINPVFLVPRTSLRDGDASRASVSTWTRETAATVSAEQLCAASGTAPVGGGNAVEDCDALYD